jgi:hypothetical protein
MSFQKINHAFEHWLRTQCAVVEVDLHCKHKKMRQSPFDFLRATFFRWSGRIEAICPEIKHAPGVLSVGDTHVENFGTWRDVEGRLVWGINDFDEAAIIPTRSTLSGSPRACVWRLTARLVTAMPRTQSSKAIRRASCARGPPFSTSRRHGCGRSSPVRIKTAAISGRKSMIIRRRFCRYRRKPNGACDEVFRRAHQSSGSQRAGKGAAVSADHATWPLPAGVAGTSCARQKHSSPQHGIGRMERRIQPRASSISRLANIVRPIHF